MSERFVPLVGDDPVDAVAEAWASVDGRLDEYLADKAEPLPDDGTYGGYREDAKSLIKRIEDRGFVLVAKETGVGG